ncbi:MAG: UDP-N-acetylmuramoyl-tripeptide--D-alanyl-D-alanine ligase [Traorella sp.]
MHKKCSEVAKMLGIEWDGLQEDKMISGVCFDSRQVKENDLFIPLIGERVNGHRFGQQVADAGASCILWNKNEDDVPSGICVLKVDDTSWAFKELARNYRDLCGFKIVGITGSNGKTSTKDLVSGVLSSKYKVEKTMGNYNSEVGVCYTICNFDEDIDVGIVEMGMENRYEIEQLCQIARPDIGIITNVGTAHLENLGSQENIAKAKCELIDSLSCNGVLVYNGDDSYLVNEIKNHRCPKNTYSYGQKDGNDCQLLSFKQTEKGITFSTNLVNHINSSLLGKHQAYNGMAAILVARSLGLNQEEIIRGFTLVAATKWRTQLESIGECKVLNDVYKSNPQSALAALETFQELESDYKVVVFGDMFDLGENTKKIHYDLGQTCANFDCDILYCIGELSKEIQKGALDAGLNAIWVESQEKLVNLLLPYTNQNCLILIKGSRGMHLDKVLDELKGVKVK